MTIQYYGLSCFKIITKPLGRATDDVVIFIDPFNKTTGLRSPYGQATAVFVTYDSPAHNNITACKDVTVVVNSPGEYAIRGVSALGAVAYADDKNGAERGTTTIFVLESEGIKLAHLGALGSDLTPKHLELLGGTDILFLPVGNKEGLSPKQAKDIARQIEPEIVIPMHYKIAGANIPLDDEKKFCSEIGNCPKETVTKLTVKQKDLEEKSMKIVLMSPV